MDADDILHFHGDVLELSAQFPDFEFMIASVNENGARFHIRNGRLTERTPEGWVEVGGL